MRFIDNDDSDHLAHDDDVFGGQDMSLAPFGGMEFLNACDDDIALVQVGVPTGPETPDGEGLTFGATTMPSVEPHFAKGLHSLFAQLVALSDPEDLGPFNVVPDKPCH